MRQGTILSITIASLTLTVGGARADTAAFDKQMAPIVAQYAKIHGALAADSTKGVAAAAKRIARLSKALRPKAVGGTHAKHYHGLPKTVAAAAVKLSKAKGIAKARAAFMELSRPLAMWVTMSKPPGINVIFCSMAKGSWLQTGDKIRNPYYGQEMLECGEVVSGKGAGQSGKQMKHHNKPEGRGAHTEHHHKH